MANTPSNTGGPASGIGGGPAPAWPARRHAGDPARELPVSRSPVHLDDLLEGLLWPRLLRAPALALSPGRVGLAAFLVVALFTLDRLWRAAFGGSEPGPLLGAIAGLRRPAGVLFDAILPRWADGSVTWSPNLEAAGGAVLELFVQAPVSMIVGPDGHVVKGLLATLVLAPIGAALTAVVGGAICRSVVCEFAWGKVLPWTRALGFGVSRWGSLLGALVGPVVVVWVLCLLMLAAGWLMKWPGLNFIGGLAFPAVLVLALLGSLVMASYVVGHGLLAPAVACDNADGFDAIQRAYAYVHARPLRLVGYWLVALVVGALSVMVVNGFVSLVLVLASRTTGWEVAGTIVLPEGAGWSERATAALVSFWAALLRVAAFAYSISFYFTASTLVYLVIRRVVDDQDLRDNWEQPAEAGAPPGAGAALAGGPSGGASSEGGTTGAKGTPAGGNGGAPSAGNPDPADYA